MAVCVDETVSSLFVFGGCDHEDDAVDSVERLEIDANGDPVGTWIIYGSTHQHKDWTALIRSIAVPVGNE